MTCIAASYRRGYGAIGCDAMVSGVATGRIVSTKVLDLSTDARYGAFVGVAGMAITLEHLRDVELSTATNEEEWEDYLRYLSKFLRETGGESVLLTLSPWGIWDVTAEGVFKCTRPIASIGSGDDIALGAMSVALSNPLWTPRSVVNKGLVQACKLAPGCGEPITIYTL